MNEHKRFHIHTFGCKINQYESQSLREAWAARGLVEAEGVADADLLVFNSCAVTNRAVADLRRTVRRLRRENPEARVVVTGCAVQVLEDELRKTFPDVELVPQADKDALHRRIPAMADVLAGAANAGCAPLDAEPAAGSCADAMDAADASPNSATRFQHFAVGGYNRARAVVKVQDGCSHRCTYCIVPDTRGPAVSRPADESVAEVRRLFEAGWREITLSGINLRQFGRDLNPAMDFWDLVARLERDLAPEWAGRARLRISSLDPGQMNDKALETLAASRLVCPQLHLSLQSLAPDVLRGMGRGHYGPELVLDWVKALKGVWPLFGLGADLLVGFPGETDDDFALTKHYCEKLPLSYAHVFPYSRRPGTPAARRKDQVPSATAKERAAMLRELAERKKAAFLRTLSARDELAVVVQGDEPPRGVCEFYAECRFDGPAPAAPGSLVRARPVAARDGWLLVTARDDE